MGKKLTFIPHWFKYISKEKHPMHSKAIFGTSYYKTFINKPRLKELPNIAFFLDGIFYPTTTGQSYHVTTLLNALATKDVCPFLFRCYRGWENPDIFKAFAFNTVCIKPDVFYNDLDKVINLIKRYEIKNAVFDTAEVILQQGALVKESAGINLIYDVPNIDPVLSGLAGLSQKMVSAQTKQLTLADKYVDVYWIKSGVDAKYLLNMGFEKRKVKVNGSGVDFSKIRFKERGILHNPIRAVFVGNMYYPPNKMGLVSLRETKTACSVKGVNIEMDVIGDGDLGSLSKEFTELNFLGRTEKLSAALLRYDLAFACPAYGSGISMKILDYMASGLPVIANSAGIRGHARRINNCILLNNDSSLHASIEKMVGNKKLCPRLSRMGHRYALDNFDIHKKIGFFMADIKNDAIS